MFVGSMELDTGVLTVGYWGRFLDPRARPTYRNRLQEPEQYT